MTEMWRLIVPDMEKITKAGMFIYYERRTATIITSYFFLKHKNSSFYIGTSSNSESLPFVIVGAL